MSDEKEEQTKSKRYEQQHTHDRWHEAGEQANKRERENKQIVYVYVCGRLGEFHSENNNNRENTLIPQRGARRTDAESKIL